MVETRQSRINEIMQIRALNLVVSNAVLAFWILYIFLSIRDFFSV